LNFWSEIKKILEKNQISWIGLILYDY
jgi:hypothetical protein